MRYRPAIRIDHPYVCLPTVAKENWKVRKTVLERKLLPLPISNSSIWQGNGKSINYNLSINFFFQINSYKFFWITKFGIIWFYFSGIQYPRMLNFPKNYACRWSSTDQPFVAVKTRPRAAQKSVYYQIPPSLHVINYFSPFSQRPRSWQGYILSILGTRKFL